MGVGKSTVGKKLAKKLKFNLWYWSNYWKKRKKENKEIFEDEGEDYFRKIEKKLVLKNLKRVILL